MIHDIVSHLRHLNCKSLIPNWFEVLAGRFLSFSDVILFPGHLETNKRHVPIEGLVVVNFSFLDLYGEANILLIKKLVDVPFLLGWLE